MCVCVCVLLFILFITTFIRLFLYWFIRYTILPKMIIFGLQTAPGWYNNNLNLKIIYRNDVKLISCNSWNVEMMIKLSFY